MRKRANTSFSAETDINDKKWRPYGLTVLVGWIVLWAAGAFIASSRGIGWAVAGPVLAAFLLEFAFYVFPAFSRLREELVDSVPVLGYAGLLAISGVLPYLVASTDGSFDLNSFARLAVIAVVVSYWYVFRRPSLSSDIAILALIGVILLAKVFRGIYVFRIDERVDVLGALMLFRLFYLVMLTIREIDRTGFTYLPSKREWSIGFAHFAAFAPIGFGIGWSTGFIRWEPSVNSVAFAPLQFLGFLWVTALFEEFLFRGIILQRIDDYARKPVVALIVSSIIFGLCHISFGGIYPNWKFVIVAGVAGVFYGHAFQKGQGIGASMVAHALTITVWRAFFRM